MVSLMDVGSNIGAHEGSDGVINAQLWFARVGNYLGLDSFDSHSMVLDWISSIYLQSQGNVFIGAN